MSNAPLPPQLETCGSTVGYPSTYKQIYDAIVFFCHKHPKPMPNHKYRLCALGEDHINCNRHTFVRKQCSEQCSDINIFFPLYMLLIYELMQRPESTDLDLYNLYVATYKNNDADGFLVVNNVNGSISWNLDAIPNNGIHFCGFDMDEPFCPAESLYIHKNGIRGIHLTDKSMETLQTWLQNYREDWICICELQDELCKRFKADQLRENIFNAEVYALLMRFLSYSSECRLPLLDTAMHYLRNLRKNDIDKFETKNSKDKRYVSKVLVGMQEAAMYNVIATRRLYDFFIFIKKYGRRLSLADNTFTSGHSRRAYRRLACEPINSYIKELRNRLYWLFKQMKDLPKTPDNDPKYSIMVKQNHETFKNNYGQYYKGKKFKRCYWWFRLS